jgi:phage repressor protein C with HTH and peptisase S24 domain
METIIQVSENQLEKNSLLLDRIQQVKSVLGFKRDIDVANALNMSSSYLYEILSGKKNVPKTFGQKLEDNLKISRRWFDTGEGEMILRNDNQTNAKALGDINYPIDPEETPFLPLGDGQYVMIIPLISERAYAGYLSGYKDPEWIDDQPKHTLIVSKQHRGIYQAFEVSGDSMENPELPRESIYDGNIVTGRQVQRHLWKSKLHTHRWRDFVIVHKEGILIKRIKDHQVVDGLVILESLNPDKETYPDKPIHLNDVFQIFNIVNVSQSR